MTATIRSFIRGGAALCVEDSGGAGLPVIFQHGLCGDAKQVAEVFPNDPRFRRITLECRGHGASELGDGLLSIASFTDDLVALIESLGETPVVVGGISMGAAISLRLAVYRPDLVRALILARPAWLTRAAPANMAPNAEVGRLLSAMAPAEALATFLASKTARDLKDEAPANLASLESFFTRAPISTTAALLRAIAADGPGVSDETLRALKAPTLVIGHGRDAIHPFAHAQALAALIPHARLVAITAKADDKRRYIADFQTALATFLEVFL